MFTVTPAPAQDQKQEKREKREFGFLKRLSCLILRSRMRVTVNAADALPHIRTMFTVTPHPTKIKQENKRKGV